MARAIYLTHPEVEIVPDIAVPDWGLSARGHARVAALTASSVLMGWHVVSSAERKALETAWPLSAKARLALEVRPLMHENDRSATGFLNGSEFEAAADQFFAQPEVSFRGWERAVDAQARILAEVQQVLAGCTQNVIFCGHGGVGTLLYCALAGHEICRRWDQTGGGHWFAFDTESLRPEAHWAPIEALTGL